MTYINRHTENARIREFNKFLIMMLIAFLVFSTHFVKGIGPGIILETRQLEPSMVLNPFVEALQFYPELHDKQINVREGKLRTTMNCRPSVYSLLFKKKVHWTYQIRVNNAISKDMKFGSPLYVHLSSRAAIGVFAHELGHIVDFESKNRVEIATMGLRYKFSSAYKRKIEHQIDSITIAKGAGNYLFEFASYIHDEPTLSEKYKAFKAKIYYSPKRITEALQKYPELYDLQAH